jgi:hypothetical protein
MYHKEDYNTEINMQSREFKPLCQIKYNDETMQHLFFKCPSVKKVIKEIEAIFNRSGLTANIEIKE